MYNFLSEQFFAAALRLKYALNTEDEFDFAGAALTGKTLFVGEGNLSFALCIAEQLDKLKRKTVCATTFEFRYEWSETTMANATFSKKRGQCRQGWQTNLCDNHQQPSL